MNNGQAEGAAAGVDARRTAAFPVERLAGSRQFCGVQKDVLRGLLPQEREYTLEEAQQAVTNYTTRKVDK